MTRHTHNTGRASRAAIASPGFTLTEILIALALVSLLLVGISRIFAMTSTTISIGQGLSSAIRGQRAIGQALSNDILGAGKDPARPDFFSGMLPLDAVEGSKVRQPAIIISNYRQAAFNTLQEERNDTDYNLLNAAAKLDATARSQAIRTMDADGIRIPRYSYGVRNHRLDTVSFFTSGQFTRQTGSQVSPNSALEVNTTAGEASSLFVAPLSSSEAWVWYGHLRIFNGDITKLDFTDGYGSPGSPQTGARLLPDPTLGINNQNNLYASQFRLGRMQVILKEPEDHDGDPGTLPTVVGDEKLAQNFIFRMNGLNPSPASSGPYSGWLQPTDNIYFKKDSESPLSNPNRLARTPLSFGSQGQIFAPNSANDNHTPVMSGTKPLSIETCRSDVAGVSASRFRERLAALFERAEDAYADTQRRESALEYINTWQDPLFASARGNSRPYCNPFPSIPFDSKKMSQRSHLLADNVTSFIVEFAGDFGTQVPNGTFTSLIPDGTTDFVAIPRTGSNYDYQTRWYGMPRDVDGDGVIIGGTNASATAIARSPDVIPVRDCVAALLQNAQDAQGLSYIGMPFEKVLPAGPGTNDNYLNDLASPGVETQSSYICAWGPQDFEGLYDRNGYYKGLFDDMGLSTTATVQYRPLLLRVIVDMTDPQGKLSEPMTQEYVFPVRVHN